MARLISYPILSTVTSEDLLPITDISDPVRPLKNVTLTTLREFVNDGATLQRVISTGNTYQGAGGPLWTWEANELTAASSTLSTSLSERRFKVTSITTGSYTDVLPSQLIFNDASGNETNITTNTGLSGNVDLQWPSRDGVLALDEDITSTNIVPAKRIGFQIKVTNKTAGSPNFNDIPPSSQQTRIYYDRQAGNNINWSQYGNQFTPSLDPGYDASASLNGTDNIRAMLEKSVKDVLTRQGSSSIDSQWIIMGYDNWMLASQQIDLAVRVDNNGASPGNGTLLVELVEITTVSTPFLPSTVCVWLVDTTDTSTNMAGPVPSIVWAGKDTAYAKVMNNGNEYRGGATFTFTGNTGDTFRKYALLVEDEYYSNMRSKYLKVSGGRVVFQNLPTADPVSEGVLWNDNGTLKISQG